MKKMILLLSVILHTNYFYTSQENQTDNQLFGIENEAKEAQQKPEQEEANEKTSSIEQEMAQLKAALHQEKLEKEQLEKALLENKQLTEIDKNKTKEDLRKETLQYMKNFKEIQQRQAPLHEDAQNIDNAVKKAQKSEAALLRYLQQCENDIQQTLKNTEWYNSANREIKDYGSLIFIISILISGCLGAAIK